MKKNLLVLLTLLCCFAGFSQTPPPRVTVTVNTNPSALVDKLLGSDGRGCLVRPANSSIKNGTTPTNVYSNGTGLGTYVNNHPSFPFASGVVLVSGDAATATGPNPATNVSSDTDANAVFWTGDADLEAALSPRVTMRSLNAAVLEFDFTAVTTSISIPYLFASEEYGAYQCRSKDGMAILIKPAASPSSAYVNIARLPNGDPISVATVRNGSNNSACAGVNDSYFGIFNGGDAADTAATNFEGQTVVLTATYSGLTVGATYHIKIVVADDADANPNIVGSTDTTYNSGVFFPEGLVNLGQNVLSANLTAANNSALCLGETYRIDTGLGSGYTFSWRNSSSSTVIGNQSYLDVTATGTYIVTVSDGSCSTSQSVDVEFANPPAVGTASNLYACPNPSGQYVYNLTANNNALLSMSSQTVVSYHTTLADAQSGNAPITNGTYTTTVGSTVTIYARVKSTTGSCYTTASFDLIPVVAPTAATATPIVVCESSFGSNTAVFDLTQRSAEILGSQDPTQYSIGYYQTLSDATSGVNAIAMPNSYSYNGATGGSATQTIYARVQNVNSSVCYAISQFTIRVSALPQVTTLLDQERCGSYALEAIPNGEYWTQPGGTGTHLAVGTVINSTQLIYIYNVNADGCFNQSQFNVRILTSVAGIVPPSGTYCDSYTLPALPPGHEYHYAAGGADAPVAPGTQITTTGANTIYYFIPTASSCTATSNFVVTIVKAQQFADVVLCPYDASTPNNPANAPYRLPAPTAGNTYWSAPGGSTGGGTQYVTNYPVTTTSTIYVHYQGTNCSSESSFNVYITPTIRDVQDVSACSGYTLPTNAVGSYYSAQGGNPANLITNNSVTATRTFWLYYKDPVSNCVQEKSFTVTITPRPAVPSQIQNVTACGSYTLPTYASIAGYYTGPNATGTFYAAGTAINQTTQLYAVTNTVNGCFNQRLFTITIVGGSLTIQPVTRCGEYILPTLDFGNYYAASGGPSPTNPAIQAGRRYTSTTTIWVYQTFTSGGNTCSAEAPLVITINPEPVATVITDVVTCDPYILPALAAGETYHTAAGGTGTTLAVGTPITSSQIIYIYASNSDGCTDESQFNVTVVDPAALNPGNQTSCGPYTLPSLPIGNYFNGPNGTGGAVTSPLIAGQLVYIYVPVTYGNNCTNNLNFNVVVNTRPVLDMDYRDVSSCNSYTLPAITTGHFYSQPNGAGSPIDGSTITVDNTTVYVYAGTTGCEATDQFVVRITPLNVTPIPDQTVCESAGYIVPATQTISGAVVGYYTGPGGPASNTALLPNDVLTSSQRIYIYAYLTANTACAVELSYYVTVLPSPTIDVTTMSGVVLGTDGNGLVAQCNSYTLPAYPTVTPMSPTTTIGYYTQPNGAGTQLTPGQVISTMMPVYVYVRTGGTYDCSAEALVNINVNPSAPVFDPACDEFFLPVLPAGQEYRTAESCTSGPGGTVIPAGTRYTSSTRIYWYIPSAAACTCDKFIDIVINHTPVLDTFNPVYNVCDEYVLPTLTAGHYYSQPNGTGTQYNAGARITSSMTMYVYAETGTTPNCSVQASFDIRVTPRPARIVYSNAQGCEVYRLPALPVGDYHYYKLSGGPLVAGQVEYQPNDPITDVVNPTVVYIYSEPAGHPECAVESFFTIRVYSTDIDAQINNLAAQANALSNATAATYTDSTIGGQLSVNVEACDSYTLPNYNIGNDPTDSYIEHYYVLPGGSSVAGQQIVTNLTLDATHPQYDPATQTVKLYLHRILRDRFLCEDQAVVNVKINQTPVMAVPPGALTDCDQVMLPALPAPFAYYNQTGGVSPITDLTLTASQNVYVYAQTGSMQICSTEYSFPVTVNTIDIPNPGDVVACDQYTLPVPVPATARYFQYSGGPTVAGQVEYQVTPTAHTFTPGDYDVYLWDVTSTVPACTDEEMFHIKVIARPTPITPSPVIECSIDDSGIHAYFDLTTAVSQAIGGQTNVVASVHETQADADFAQNAISDITNYYNLNRSNQTLYIRLYSSLSTDCYTVVPLQLVVNPRPIAVDPVPAYEMCDNGANDTDGIALFDLTTYIPQVLGTLNSTQHTVSFYETLADLQAGAAQIATPGTYNSASTTVYIKVTINATGCYDVVPLQLIVNPKPVVVTPSPYTLCDVNAPGDEVELFDLTTKIPEITNGVLGLNVTFYTNLTDAEAGTNAIATPTAYQNTPGVQAIFVRVTNAVTGCYRVVLLDIRVEPLPVLTPLTADERTVCSTNDDGYGVFDLDQMETEMIDGGTNIDVIFYPTLISAINDINPIANTAAYQNINPFTDTVVAVPVNTITGCKGTPITITLIVNPAPADVRLQDIVKCDELDGHGEDNSMVFDLTQQDPLILAQLPAGSYVVNYFTSLANANFGSPRIINPQTWTGTNNQEIWVRVEYPSSECFIVTSFKLKINQPQTLAHPANLIICDDTTANDGIATFDLTVREDEILTVYGVGEGNVVRYFTSAADRDAGTNPITTPDAFRNTVNPQDIFVSVTTPLGCVSKESMLIMVNPLPVPNPTPLPLILCDVVDSSIGDAEGYQAFDLTLAAANILAGDSLSQVHYYANTADFNAGVEIVNPASYVNAVQWNDTVIVSLTRTGTQTGAPTCEQHVTLNLQVNPLPPVYDPATGDINYYAICNPVSTGYEQFNLIQHINDQLTANGVNPTDYYIRFYLNRSNYLAGIPLPHVYTNTTQYAQEIFISVRNNTTNCEITGTMWLYAEQAAIANPIVSAANSPIVVCDSADGLSDGFAEFDLTSAGLEALGAQSPTDYSIRYFETQADAIADTNAIPDGAHYINTQYLNQQLWVRITNESTHSKCFAVTDFNIRVSLLPEPAITAPDGHNTICVDFADATHYRDVTLDSGSYGTGYTYQWYLNTNAIPGATSATYVATAPGDYTVVVTNADGCDSFPIPAFTVHQSGPAHPRGDGYVMSSAFSADQTLTVLVEGYGEYQYTIAPGNDDPTGPWQNSNVFENMPLGYYTIYIRDVKTDDPCSMVPITDVSIVDFPKFFTPNGDGYNDYWNIVGMSNERYADARIFVFDRFGKLIKQLSPASRTDDGEGWDGTYNGKPVPGDDYWFLVEFTENGVAREFRGHFALKR